MDAVPAEADRAVVAEAALERILTALAWRVVSSRSALLGEGRVERLPGEHPVMLYVGRGTVRVRLLAPGGAGAPCRVELVAGDLMLVPSARALDLASIDTAALVGSGPADEGARVVVVDLEFAGSAPHALDALPTLLVVRGFDAHEPAVAALAARMGCAGDDGRGRSGDSAVCASIATTVVAVAVRAWAELGCAPADWLARAEDPFVARVLDAIHDEPGRAWTVGELATVGAMSRTVFAERFRDLVGKSPASYLADVRMELAMGLFDREGLTVAEVSRRLGYESEAGFSRAFRRRTGENPSDWRRRRAAVPA